MGNRDRICLHGKGKAANLQQERLDQVVLVGTCTWQRKAYVDWEIGSSLSDTRNNTKTRCGLLGIILPSNSNYRATPIIGHQSTVLA